MRRRRYLTLTGLAATGALAGCSGGDGSGRTDGSNDTDKDTNNGTPTTVTVTYNAAITDGVRHPEHPRNSVSGPSLNYRVRVENESDQPVVVEETVRPETRNLLNWAVIDDVAPGDTETGYLLYAVNDMDVSTELTSDRDDVALVHDDSLTVDIETPD